MTESVTTVARLAWWWLRSCAHAAVEWWPVTLVLVLVVGPLILKLFFHDWIAFLYDHGRTPEKEET